MYHSISDDPADPLAVSPRQFREQMSLLAEQGYRGVSLSEALQLLDQRPLFPRAVCLTFDDGFRDFYSEALPVLEQRGFKATLFLVAGWIGKTSYWSSYRRDRPLLDWNEIKHLVALGYEMGSHTFSHVDLRTLSAAQLREELEMSKALLEAQLEMPVNSFAYPGGAFTDREVQAVAEAGYTSAVIVGGRWGNGRETHRLRLKREKMGHQDTLTDFWRKVYGYYEVFFLGKTIAKFLRRLAIWTPEPSCS